MLRARPTEVQAHFSSIAGTTGRENPKFHVAPRPRYFQNRYEIDRGPPSAEYLVRVTCWVCGKRGHLWPQCSRRKMKGCACCGSQGHRIAQCAQRHRRIQPREDEYKMIVPEKAAATPSTSSDEGEKPIEVRTNAATLATHSRLGVLPRQRQTKRLAWVHGMNQR